MNPGVDLYLKDGCGRCHLGGTPDCKVHRWTAELLELRRILLQCGLEETVKWGVPCYTWQTKNIIIISAFKESATISFFKGALLKDPKGYLQKPGENSNATRILRFTDVKAILKIENAIRNFIFQAIENEEAGKKVQPKKLKEFPIPIELTRAFKIISGFKNAFYALTPGRQKAYLLYFNDAKQSQTRDGRIMKYVEHIMKGKGLFDK